MLTLVNAHSSLKLHFLSIKRVSKSFSARLVHFVYFQNLCYNFIDNLQKAYTVDAKSIMDKYNLVTDEPRIRQALFAGQLASEVSLRMLLLYWYNSTCALESLQVQL